MVDGRAWATRRARRGPPPEASSAATEWTSDPRAAATGPSSPCASSTPMTPASTSPAPAVASQAGPSAWLRTGPSGPTTIVVDPLSSTVAPVSSARRLAAETGSAETSLLVTSCEVRRVRRRAHSPACGVSTVVRPARRRATLSSTRSRAPASSTTGSGASSTSTTACRWARPASVPSSGSTPGPATHACTCPAPITASGTACRTRPVGVAGPM